MKEKIYEEIEKEFKAVISNSKIPFESALTSLIAIIKEKNKDVSWIGFYKDYGDANLWVGPYQGKLACIHLAPGKGVCGAAFKAQKALIVDDVENFPGHIACDANTRSEIVLPVFEGDRCIGVLDLDSYSASAFDEIDRAVITRCLELIRFKTVH